LAQTASALTKSQGETKAAQADAKRIETTLTATLNATKAKADADAKAAATRYAALDRAKTEEVAKRDASIKDLQNTRDQLNAKVAELNSDITKLKSTIGTLNTRITFVEGELQVAKDDKAFLTKELARMQGERTEMERKMNDLAFLKEQMSTIKSDQAIARRVDWMRNGTFMDERKGATLLVDALKPLPSTKPTSTRGSQLNVEVHRDGTVTIKAPAPAAPKPAESGVEKSVTVGPNFPAAPAPKKK
jgi:myosin heavy subunit